MIAQNVVLHQAIVWMVFGYLVATTLHALVGYPRRLVEAQ